MKRFLLCFSPKDADGKVELVAHLSAIREKYTIWSVDEVAPGGSITREFLKIVTSADAALLLISANFFAELDVQGFAEQVAQLRQQHAERGLQLIPLLWRDCSWQAVPWLRELQPLPGNGIALHSVGKRRRDRALALIARQLDERRIDLEKPIVAGLRFRLWEWAPLTAWVIAGGTLVGLLAPFSSPLICPNSVMQGAAPCDLSAPPTFWKVEGIVRDRRQKPLSGVTVSLPELDATTETSEQGHFRFVVPADHDDLVLLRIEKRKLILGDKGLPRPAEVHVSLGSTKLDVILEE